LPQGIALEEQAQHIPELIKCGFSDVDEEEVFKLIKLLDKVLEKRS
ncbi:MarR family transcriptional regulator, partial [Pseudoalteromonas citrea]